jgi:hypothetical protein
MSKRFILSASSNPMAQKNEYLFLPITYHFLCLLSPKLLSSLEEV